MRIVSSSFLAAAALLAGCGGNQRAATDSHSTGNGSTEASTSPLARAEADTLRSMREEEKLARDLYAAFEPSGFEFARIQGMERHHFAMIGMLLERYQLPDPAASQPAGVFTDPALQAQYAELHERGTKSRADAYAVATEIEDQSLHDLQAAIEGTTHDDIRHAYAMLAQMTRNHLRVFYTGLAAEGGAYSPKYLDRPAFDRVVAAPMEPMGRMMGRGEMGAGMGPMNHGGMGQGAPAGDGVCPHMSGMNHSGAQ